ncbi:MAG: GGDEF domain-containing protein [Sulfurimonas sp.]|nr:GGDEF domain-containing protein [Sulfurimonas sp.]
MSSRQKFTITLIGLFIIFLVAMVLIVIINFRNYGIKSAESEAMLTAEIVKSGLTAHMVNGIMDKRSFFLDKVQSAKNIDAIWIARSQTVIKQYGEGFNNEIPRDDIDKKVLKTGKVEKIITETATSSKIRITVPYIASAFGKPNCLNCHDAKEGDVLGTITMVIDSNDGRIFGFNAVILTILSALLILGLVLFIINRFISPYFKVFYSIKNVMDNAYIGNYSIRVENSEHSESKDVATKMNALLQKLESVLEEIETKVYVFMQNQTLDKYADPLININSTIDQLSEIYKFKQTIEDDETLADIYERLAYVLRHNFGLEDFSFIEANTLTKEKKIVYSSKGISCSIESGECRSDRTNAVIDSTIFNHICPYFDKENCEYICIPYSISNEMNLIVSIVTKGKNEATKTRKMRSLIENYISTARPSIVSRKLMQILSEMARIDQLTGMYNRKYLDEFADKSIPQALRTGITYGILMLDIDFFKMINDTYGHDVGDEGIRTISRVIKENIRESDVAIRFGGEEFIILLYNCNKEYINEIAEKIRIAFSKEKIDAGTSSFSKTLSVGSSMFPDDSKSIWKCIKFADIALYYAKETGRNRSIAFDESLIKEGTMNEIY